MFKHNYVHTQRTWRVSLVPGSKVDNHRHSEVDSLKVYGIPVNTTYGYACASKQEAGI